MRSRFNRERKLALKALVVAVLSMLCLTGQVGALDANISYNSADTADLIDICGSHLGVLAGDTAYIQIVEQIVWSNYIVYYRCECISPTPYGVEAYFERPGILTVITSEEDVGHEYEIDVGAYSGVG